MTIADPFEVPGTSWAVVSPRLAVLRRLLLLALGVPVLLMPVVILAGLGLGRAGVSVAVLGAAGLARLWFVLARAVAAWSYAERDEDLLLRSGVWVRRLTVVPYGRMQFVDVTSGPLERRFGLATVRLHTASASTDASLPGLVPAEAARLRDRLAARGEAQAAGL